MKVTIEISNYPLNSDFENQILDFINRIKAHSSLKVSVKATCTHITGDYDEVMSHLNQEMKLSFEKYGKMIFVIKVLKGALEIEKVF
jgi:uncharacterized protein YqgV (UPF0045/DUF77 family)